MSDQDKPEPPRVIWGEQKGEIEIFHATSEHQFREVSISPHSLDHSNPDKERKIPYLVCVICGHTRPKERE